MTQPGTFEELLLEGASVPVQGWDFSWFEGRASEERPSWHFSELLVHRIKDADAILDVQTGGGENLAGVLNQLNPPPNTLAATESWPPNVAGARRNLRSLGVTVDEVGDNEALPYSTNSFDFVMSRHPTIINWSEITRVLRPGATYLSQQVGPGTNRELKDFIMGTQPISHRRNSEIAVGNARESGLEIVDVREESLRVEFFDIAAIVYFLRKVVWTVPDFTVEQYGDELHRLYRHIEDQGKFVSYAKRFLLEAVKPSL
jgi:SAM-dependent methyltransferase